LEGFDKLSPNGGGKASTSSARTAVGRLRQAQPERRLEGFDKLSPNGGWKASTS